jgi:hypothetical protein
VGRTLLALALVLGLGAAGYALRCPGPRPEVLAAGTWAGADGAHAAATVRNDGGEGEVEVRFRAVERRSGARVAADATVQLGEGEQGEVVAPAPLPPGQWEVEAEAEYPPR